MRQFRYVLFLAVFFLLSAQHISFKRSPDIGRFLRDGELIVAGQTAVLHQNFYSYTNPTVPFPNHHWLGAVIAYAVSNTIGYVGLNLVWIALAVGGFLLYLRVAERETETMVSTAFAAMLLPLMASRAGIRPENFSILLAAVFFWILWSIYRGWIPQWWIWTLPFLEAVWVNLHPGFALGFVLIGTFLASELLCLVREGDVRGPWKIAHLGIVLVLAVAAGFLNPNGAQGLLFPFTVSHNYAMDVRENLSMFAIADIPVTPLAGVAALALAFSWIVVFRKEIRIEWPLLILSVAFTAMSLVFYRIHVFIGGPILLALCVNFSAIRAAQPDEKPVKKKSKKSAGDTPTPAAKPFGIWIWSAWALAAAGIASFLFTRADTTGLGLEPDEEALAQFVKAAGISGKVFNGYGSGGYMIHFLPEQKVYFDSRPEAYPGDFVQRDYQQAIANEDDWKRALEKYDFDFIFFAQFNQHEGQFLVRRLKDPEWSVVRSGLEMVLVRNKPQFEEVIRKYKQRF